MPRAGSVLGVAGGCDCSQISALHDHAVPDGISYGSGQHLSHTGRFIFRDRYEDVRNINAGSPWPHLAMRLE